MIQKLKLLLALLAATIFFNITIFVHADDKIDSVIDQIQIISQDLKTLEKAVYKKSDIVRSTNSSSLNEDVLAKHLLKLNDIEEQFRSLTNKFEEINFRIDKLSKRVTKIQSDTQLRISDLESGNLEKSGKKKLAKKKEKPLAGTSKAQDFGATPGYSTSNLPKEQAVTSVDSVVQL